MAWTMWRNLVLFTGFLAQASPDEEASCPSSFFERAELEEMMTRWQAANVEAEKLGNWSALADFYTSDAVYSWNMGFNREFVAKGREEIRNVALGWFMQGFERWNYPYHDVIIDTERGAVVAFWKQIAPTKRSDGSDYQVDGLSGSRFQYAGSYQWKWQKDFFDMGNVMALTFELAGAGELDQGVKEKIKNQARGKAMPLVQTIRPVDGTLSGWLLDRAKQIMAITRIVVFGW